MAARKQQTENHNTQRDALLVINEAVTVYCENHDVGVYFVPRARYGGKFMPEFDFGIQMDGRRLTDVAMCRLIAADYFKQGISYGIDLLRSALWEWVWNRYLRDQEYGDALALMPRIEIQRKRGRPRKDGTSHTVYIKAVAPTDPVNTSDKQHTE